MARFLPISSLDERLTLSPEFYIESHVTAAISAPKSGLLPVMPPLNLQELLANSCLLALLDSGIALDQTSFSFVLIDIKTNASSGDEPILGCLKRCSWNGAALDCLEVSCVTTPIWELSSLVQEQGVFSKNCMQFGISGAVSNLAATMTQIEKISTDVWPFVLFPSSEDGKPTLSLIPEDAVTFSEEVHPSLLDRSTTASDGFSEAQGFQLDIRADSAPDLAVVQFPASRFGADFFFACVCHGLSRETLIQFMDALAVRLKEQQNFLDRCWHIIGTEISSRIRHMFKNRIGSAYGEIESITRVATENGWLSALTESADVIKVQQEIHHDSDDYYQVSAHLGRIRQYLNSLERAVDQLSKFYRGYQGTPELVAVNRAVETQLANWRAARPDVGIRKELDPVDPVCRIVPDALAEILDNIFINSKKFIPQETGHHLLVSTQLSRDKIVISIANDGPSQLPDEPTKLFVTTDPQGTGVGLHLVERLVSEAGGNFSISLRPDGPGVLNRIELPNPKWKSED